MILRTLILSGYIIWLSSCTPLSDRAAAMSEPAANPAHRYEIERVSFLPPQGNGWESVNYQITGSIGFFSYKDGIRNMRVAIEPFEYRLNANNFDKFSQRILAESKEAQAKIDNSTYGQSGMKYYRARILSKAGTRNRHAAENTGTSAGTRGYAGNKAETGEKPIVTQCF